MGPKAWCVLGKPSGLKPGFTIQSSIYPKLCQFQFTRGIAIVGFGVGKRKDSELSCDHFRVYGVICSARLVHPPMMIVHSACFIYVRLVEQLFKSDESTDDDPTYRLPVSNSTIHVRKSWLY